MLLHLCVHHQFVYYLLIFHCMNLHQPGEWERDKEACNRWSGPPQYHTASLGSPEETGDKVICQIPGENKGELRRNRYLIFFFNCSAFLGLINK